MLKKEILEADVLCVGGGITGLMAAIRASELGANVVVVEKGNVLRSGAGAMGNDHFACYIPEIHGRDFKAFIEEVRMGQLGPNLREPEIAKTWFENTFDIVKLWESWGIPMKYKGRYEFSGHGFPGRPHFFLRYSGQQQKPILTKQALKRRSKVINRVTVIDLTGDEKGVTGAIGMDTREERLIEFRAKSVILGTGRVQKLYQGLTPGWIFNMSCPGTLSGDGRAMAYRLGAELIRMEIPAQHAGPKYFVRAGQGTWVGVVRDSDGKPVGPFLTKPDKRYSDIVTEVNKNLFMEYAKSGRGPVYLDCRGISEEDYEYMMHWMNNEGNVALLNHLQEEGIDLRKNPIEWMTYEIRSTGRISTNAKSETSIKGLYAAGDEVFSSISNAAIFGWIAGENAAKYTEETATSIATDAKAKIEEIETLLNEIRNRKVGPDWKEVNIALQQTMSDYTGSIRSEKLLEAGLNHLRRLKQKAHSSVLARNQHELMRCIEVFNLLDLGELVFVAARAREETRGRHMRSDYTFTNPLMDKPIVVKKVGNEPIAMWKETN